MLGEASEMTQTSTHNVTEVWALTPVFDYLAAALGPS